MIAENGATREVPKTMMLLHWYEGLLLLDELEQSRKKAGSLQAEWLDDELLQVLEQERTKLKRISGPSYLERRLVNTSVTGNSFLDRSKKQWRYRREGVEVEDESGRAEGEDANGYFKIKDVIEYLPPWQAFCHEKCGFYQDFYLVRWEFPFSEVDYSKVENGCTTMVGATWEPDECLPAHLDSLRIASKTSWIKKQREMEPKPLAAKRPGPSPPAEAEGSKRPRRDFSAATPEGLTPRTDGFTPKFLVKTRNRRDGKPLEPDTFRLSTGHDFVPGEYAKIADIRNGWPRTPQDYPAGYRVANPPGFCFESCDCMDDGRLQTSWEVHKAWLEQPERSNLALAALELFSRQSHFVRRRTTASMFVETTTGQVPDQTHAMAALDLAGSIGRQIGKILEMIPVQSIVAGKPGPAVAVPAISFLLEEHDAVPLRYEGSLRGGGALPAWLQLDVENGVLQATANHGLKENLHFQVELIHSEGCMGTAVCAITPQRSIGSSAPWVVATGIMIARFTDVAACPLDWGARAVLAERLSEIYDFELLSSREVSLGQWLKSVGTVMRMLRTTAVAHNTRINRN